MAAKRNSGTGVGVLVALACWPPSPPVLPLVVGPPSSSCARGVRPAWRGHIRRDGSVAAYWPAATLSGGPGCRCRHDQVSIEPAGRKTAVTTVGCGWLQCGRRGVFNAPRRRKSPSLRQSPVRINCFECPRSAPNAPGDRKAVIFVRHTGRLRRRR